MCVGGTMHFWGVNLLTPRSFFPISVLCGA